MKSRRPWDSKYPERKEAMAPAKMTVEEIHRVLEKLDFKTMEARFLSSIDFSPFKSPPARFYSLAECEVPPKPRPPPRLPEWYEVRGVYDGPARSLIGKVADIRFKLTGGFGFAPNEEVEIRFQGERDWHTRPLSHFVLKEE